MFDGIDESCSKSSNEWIKKQISNLSKYFEDSKSVIIVTSRLYESKNKI
jgi:predicted NACHT family NTPase